MDASIKHYEEIEKRIKTYYPECSITQLGDKMIVEMPMGKLEVRGYRVSFTAFGEPFGELDFENENELYEGIESYIVAMGNEVEKCNLTFITALKNAEKRCRITLRAGMAAFLLLLLGYYLFDLSMIVLLIGLLMPIAATVSLRFVRLHSFRRDWVCPHCGAKLPLTAKEWIPQMKSVAHCPVCGKELLDHALMEQRKLEVLSENDEEVQNGEAHEENRNEKTIARQTELLKPSGRRSCKIFGAMVLIFALFFGALMFVDIDQADPVITAVNAIALLLTAAAGVVLMRCDNTEQGNPEISNISVREQKWLSGVGISIGLFGMVLLFVSFVESTVTPVPFGTVMLFTVLGLFFIALSVWMLLARKNRSLLIYNTHLVYTTSFGHTKDVALAQIASVRVTINNAIHFLDQNARKIFSIESNMVGAIQVIDWIEEQNFEVNATKAMQKKVNQETDSIVSWSEEYRTPLHDHLGAIRIGLVLVIFLLVAGSIVPYLLYLFTDLKIAHAIYLTTFSPLPMILYYIDFAPVFLVGDCPAGATNEWKSMHIKFPMMLVVLIDLLICAQVYYFWEERILQIVDTGRFLLLWAGLTAVLIALFWIRTPKRMRTQDGFAMMILSLMMLGFVLTFGGSLVISGPVEHYPAVFVERHEPTEEQKDSDRTLTILLDDGTTAELNVNKHLYDLEEAGVEFVVCQKENFLGIRMVRMHLPERTDTSTLPEVSETTS